MTVARATIDLVAKPWGRIDLRPWIGNGTEPEPTGEAWFARPQPRTSDESLLFKLIFADAPLSIQVHPDDAFAQAHGQPNGKTEAWYILAAKNDAQIAVGLTRRVTERELRASIADGSIAQLVAWRPVSVGDTIVIPAGTVHAIGAGVTLAEIQQCSDTTFRLFDFGRGRDLHIDDAIAVSDREPALADEAPIHLDRTRDILVENPYFILERIDLAPRTGWGLAVERATMMFVLAGHAAIGLVTVTQGSGVFLGAGDSASIETGMEGMSALVSYPGPARMSHLLNPIINRAEVGYA
jgi:mannose-6-phosphate isomerase